MGTNFYWQSLIGEGEDDDPTVHIGKRSAAGLYCWDCDISLEILSHEEVASLRSVVPGFQPPPRYDAPEVKTILGNRRYAHCPKCKAVHAPKVGEWEGPVAVELGFAAPATERKRGVEGCSSFGWAQDPAEVRRRCEAGEMVTDEYGRSMTGSEFLAMVDANCPIQETHFVGRWFS